MQGNFGIGALVIFVLTIGISLLGLFAQPKLIDRSLFRPYWFLRRKQYETIITSGFVHADVGHLFFNMMTYYFFAFPMERYIGTGGFFLLYFLGMTCSEVGTYFKQRRNPEYATLGASGAILAVLFASIVYAPQQKLFVFPIPLPIPAPLFAVLYLAYSYYSAHYSRGRINHDAHIAGALTGLAFVAVTQPSAFANFLSMFTGG